MQISDFGFKPLGKLAVRKSTEIESSRLGVGFETLDREMWNVEQAWPVLEDLGVKWARVQTGWARTEKQPGAYDFKWLDTIVDKLLARGVTPWFNVGYGNRLYTPEASQDGACYPPVYTEREKSGWSAYVRALSEHFRGRVRHFEIWNEPDGGFFKPKPDPKLYVELLKASAEAVRAAQTDAFVIGGSFACGMHPSEFMHNCFRYGIADYCDAISQHNYKIMPEQYVDQQYPAFRRLLQKHKPALQYWQGETGCPSEIPPGNTQALHELKTSESVQARMLLRRLLIELSLDASLVSYFSMGDFSKYLLDGELGYTSHYGLLRLADGSPKPAYYTLQSLATILNDPLKTADGATSTLLQTGINANCITREQSVAAYQVNLLRGNVPVHAWWLRESIENDSDWKSMTLYYWIEQGLKLDNPVLIEPVGKDVYELEVKKIRGLLEFICMPISNSPLLLTDRSIVPIRRS